MAQPPASQNEDARAAELREWARDHGPALRAFFRKRARPADVDDLVQDVFVRLQARAEVEPVRNVEGYLFTIAARVLIDRRRSDRTHGWDRLGSLDDAPEPADEITPERQLAAKQDHTQLILAIGRLPPRMRAAFIFHRFEQMTYPAIARRMGNSPNAVKQLLKKAFQRLAEERRS